MKKLIFIFLLAIPLCKAADSYEAAQNAAVSQQWQDLYKLIDDGSVGVNEIHNESEDHPFIYFAALFNDLDAVRELIKRGAELNRAAPSLPLQTAARRYMAYMNTGPLIELLLEEGADPHAQNNFGQSTFDSITKSPAAQLNPKAQQELMDWFQGANIKGEPISEQ